MSNATMTTTEKQWFNLGRNDCINGCPYYSFGIYSSDIAQEHYSKGWNSVKDETFHKVTDTLSMAKYELGNIDENLESIEDLNDTFHNLSDNPERFTDPEWVKVAKRLREKVQALKEEVAKELYEVDRKY